MIPEISRYKEARYALASMAYVRGQVRLVARDCSGCDYLVATRRGLFAVAEESDRLIAHGLFYGLTIADDAIYAFEAGDRPSRPTDRGRIVRFMRDGDRIVDARVIATGLDNGCHQIDVVRGDLHIVDTYRQRIVAMGLDGSARRAIFPLPRVATRGHRDYRHINSLIQDGDTVSLLLHNGGRGTGAGAWDSDAWAPGRRSEVATFDADWRLIGMRPLDGFGCHNLVPLEDGTMLSCGSLDGELIGSDGLRLRLGDMMTRGLSVDDNRILVGGSTFAPRYGREETDGAIWFLDRDYNVRAFLKMPAPVMEIRRIDGRDRSLSAYGGATMRVQMPVAA